MVILGAVVNGVCIIIGTLFGKLFSNIPESMRGTIMHAIGLTVAALGLQMALKSENFLVVILSLVIGAVIGEWLQLEERLTHLGEWLENKVGSKGKGSISEGFVTATLIFAIGAMGVLGALDSGIRGNHDILFTKAIIDGFISIILTTTLGIGVVFSAIPVILYEGGIAVFATQINSFVPKELMNQFIVEMTATGGIMIFAIGLNLLGFIKIKVANLLPGILMVGVIVSIIYGYGLIISH
ncbi:hypothetical protein IEE_03385 [Bacillus cereus BAG5X1-1]|uniref:DUF554 domain-containing protein n=1 Tax=Bacillus cereus BAG5X1-1 TaxID=1053189 RepID=J8AJA7_BACCE|nr:MULTISPECIES: DUF554 domain-containing protein [Bacillus cereus group]EJQ43207.1 hypothetical protein IEE_03385 [Bacillus cereus BAG5X1-1]MDM5461994.1 DUF554 domain-containing protein [Bacillus cereus]PGY18752.1 DUF554 domain-containing protein [Bacillus cereus]QWI49103.1 DUF554 domain-containing protein [Bacillus mycoides]WJE21983.1 DUF554 domain-containing protein [Bacillus cereus]